MIIYILYNIVNDKFYIGKTEKSDLVHRRKQHYVSAFTMNSQHYIHRAMRKYGKEAFLMVRISNATSREELDKMEMYFIAKFHSNNPTIGYNMTAGGEGRQMPHTTKTRELMSSRRKGRPLSPSHRASMVAGNQTKEAREKNRLSQTGRKHKPETIIKIKTAWTPEKKAAFSGRLQQSPTHVSADIRKASSERLSALWCDPIRKKERVEAIQKVRRGTVWKIPLPSFASFVKNAKTISEIASACGLQSSNHRAVIGRIKCDGLDISHIRLRKTMEPN
jgi:group I intron endonuclease